MNRSGPVRRIKPPASRLATVVEWPVLAPPWILIPADDLNEQLAEWSHANG